MIVARLPGIAPNATMAVPINDVYEIVALTDIGANTYTSAPQQATGAQGFLAQVLEDAAQGTYEFEVVQVPSSFPDQLQFQSTCVSPVVFNISRNGVASQSVVVPNAFGKETLDIGNTFSAYAVINGVTTPTTQFTNANAIVTALEDTSNLESGYFTLEVS
ncbi:MAG TPA: hypothetical protein VIF60_17400 [Burkholderiaceae bacterium]